MVPPCATDLRHRRHAARREFKAVQLGGPSGGCCRSLLDEPIDFESLLAAGS